MMRLKLDPRTKVADLTVAKQQMVEIAKALSFNSQVLIMDEPTAALTDTEIDELFRIIRELRDKGVGIVHISHRLEELQADLRPGHGHARRPLHRYSPDRRMRRSTRSSA